MDRLEKSGSNDNDGFIKTVFPFDESRLFYSLYNI